MQPIDSDAFYGDADEEETAAGKQLGTVYAQSASGEVKVENCDC